MAREKVSVLTRIHLCGIVMLKKVGKDEFEIPGQTGASPVTYPDLAGMALGWAGQI